MDFKEYTNQTIDFYRDKGWYEYDPDVRINFLRQGVDQLIRSVDETEKVLAEPLENKQKIAETKELLSDDLGKLLDNLIILADKYDLNLEKLMDDHQNKRGIN
ncbi:hypothetical protein OZX68_03840 [Streptococcaceae bacterium ESL0729]|nr:hypothetical protein OZX68_03840 [Streptococcaceae bacterium ESL0729]